MFSSLSLSVTIDDGGSEPAKRSTASVSNLLFLTVTMYGIAFAATSNDGPCTISAPPEPTRPSSNDDVAGMLAPCACGRSTPDSVRMHFGATRHALPMFVDPALVELIIRSSLMSEPVQYAFATPAARRNEMMSAFITWLNTCGGKG